MPNCPNVLTHGTCAQLDCRYEHRILACEPCGFIAPNEGALNMHQNGRRHRNRMSGKTITYFCSLCERNVGGGGWDLHIAGSKHQNRARGNNVAPDIAPLQGIDVVGQKYCNTCKQAMPIASWAMHQRTAAHQMRESYASYRAALDEAEKDKNGIVVEGNFDFDFVDPTRAAIGIDSTVVLKTTTPNLRVKLISLNRVSSRTGTDTTSVAVPFSLVWEANSTALQLLRRSRR